MLKRLFGYNTVRQRLGRLELCSPPAFFCQQHPWSLSSSSRQSTEARKGRSLWVRNVLAIVFRVVSLDLQEFSGVSPDQRLTVVGSWQVYIGQDALSSGVTANRARRSSERPEIDRNRGGGSASLVAVLLHRFKGDAGASVCNTTSIYSTLWMIGYQLGFKSREDSSLQSHDESVPRRRAGAAHMVFAQVRTQVAPSPNMVTAP
ncbi:hypothetical protein FA15DRAFT_20919 [Coprinopsis marcescibilis]|uniref:Uncharacterized protein n=1 Tax=Coprinopsis marcescibilis TaxID=230819 RepID=A0A5C3LET6_COPMA|nr:hypothetical protein FA15DRAFT_20919 [Coprinopsis marcescibilis]